jgi:hypothetical protein
MFSFLPGILILFLDIKDSSEYKKCQPYYTSGEFKSEMHQFIGMHNFLFIDPSIHRGGTKDALTAVARPV